jgi:hypothetical protein
MKLSVMMEVRERSNGTAIAKALEISLLVNIIYIIIIIERAISS